MTKPIDSKNIFFSILCGLTLLFSSCAITLGPEPPAFSKSESRPILRLGDVTEEVTGTWKDYPGAGFKSALTSALQRPEVQTLFSNSASDLVADFKLTTDHENDGPRLTSLGALSLVTFGVIPLKFFSEWNADCKVVILTPGRKKTVAEYTFHERGTYKIWALPPTMFSLFGAGARGDDDGRAVAKRTAEGLVAKFMKTMDQDYSTLSQYHNASDSSSPAEGSPPAARPLIV